MKNKKVVINKCFGGFSLSAEAVLKYAELSGFKVFGYTDERDENERKKIVNNTVKPKEKAKSLYKIYLKIIQTRTDIWITCSHKQFAKELIICLVDEILLELKHANALEDIGGIDEKGNHKTRLDYWNSVKEELQKL